MVVIVLGQLPAPPWSSGLEAKSPFFVLFGNNRSVLLNVQTPKGPLNEFTSGHTWSHLVSSTTFVHTWSHLVTSGNIWSQISYGHFP